MAMRIHIFLSIAVSATLACAVDSSDEAPASFASRSVDTTLEVAPILTDGAAQTIQSLVAPPPGYERIPVGPASFGAWLRGLPVRAGRPAVLLYNGRRKADQSAHYAVLDIDVGEKDLQQCADAVIRLRAEYLFPGPCSDRIQFNFTSGDTARWKDWRDGMRPIVSGNRVAWSRTAEFDDGYSNFRDYLDTVFMYAGSASLEREMDPVADAKNLLGGDVFIEGGFPGHAVLVIDVAENEAGDRVFLLAQSYMPAQDIHILTSFEDIDPWYRAHSEGVLRTPEWDFDYENLRRFPRASCEIVGGRTPD
jgi:hypothetical protein